MLPCKARRRGDQMHCDRCALQWDQDDPEAPRCPRNDPTPQAVKIIELLETKPCRPTTTR